MTKRPNFLLLMTDQHRADHLGCYGNTVVRTPHIDSIAASGVAFDRFYVASPICMPNRATLMTGRMPSVHGVRHNGMPLPLEATTFVDRLRQAGYRTTLVGKAHLQNMTGDPANMPPDRYASGGPKSVAGLVPAERSGPGRYDQELAPKWRDDPAHDLDLPYYGFESVDLAIDHGDQVEGHYTRWLRQKRNDADSLRGPENALPSPDYDTPQAWRTRLPEELYPTSYIAERMLARLEDCAADPARPFFLKCSFPDPHHPFTPPGRYWGLYDPREIELPASWNLDRAKAPPHLRWALDQRDSGKAAKHSPALFACSEREAREATALTYGMISMVDDAIGRILDRLKALGLAENTIVMFTADHGDYMGDHQLMLKGPMHYQALVRVPFIWREPDGGARGRRSALASTLDIARTVLERAGLEPYQGLQGLSLLPSVNGSRDGRDAVLIEEEGQRVYLSFNSRVRVRTLVTERHRLSLYDGVEWGELYDLAGDPHELDNLWDDPQSAGLRAALTERLARTMVAHSDTNPYPSGLA